MSRSLRFAAGGLIASAALVLTVGGSVLAASSSPAGAVPPAVDTLSTQCAAQREAARTSPTVDSLRALGDCEIDRRLTTLGKLTSLIDGSKVMTDAHATTLSAEIASTTAGLKDLKATIDSETSVASLRTEIKRIAPDYRVYVLVARQVHLVNASDRVAAAGQKFATISSKLEARIAQAQAAGKDVTKAEADLAAMNAAVARAASLAAPIPGEVLPLTPAQYNSGVAKPILDSAHGDLVKARELLETARDDAKAVVADLR